MNARLGDKRRQFLTRYVEHELDGRIHLSMDRPELIDIALAILARYSRKHEAMIRQPLRELEKEWNILARQRRRGTNHQPAVLRLVRLKQGGFECHGQCAHAGISLTEGIDMVLKGVHGVRPGLVEPGA